MDIRIDEEGRLALPAELLRELGWTPGTALQVERTAGGVRVRAQESRTGDQGSGAPAPGGPATGIASAYGASTPAGVDTATLKEEARRLADAMRNIGQAAQVSSPSDQQEAKARWSPTAPTPEQPPRVGDPPGRPTPPAPDRPPAGTETPAELVDALFPHHAEASAAGKQGIRAASASPAPGAVIAAYKGRTPYVPTSCYVAPGAFLAGDVALGEECSVWPGASLRGDVNRIEIGAWTNVQDGAVIHVDHGHSAIIGSGVTIGHQATVHGCRVEDDVLIGIHSVVLNGARLGKGCMIAAGAVVTPGTEVPPGKLALGVPAKVARDLTPEEMEANRANAAEYVRLRGEYLRSGVQVFRCSGVQVSGQPHPEHLNTRIPEHPNTPVYRCRRVRTPVAIDGALDEAAWMAAERAGEFLLAEGDGAPRFPTEVRLCWDETHLYVAFSCPDSDVWGTYTERDDPLFDEEVVEIFLCPSGNLQHYYEFEVSPRNTLFDAKVFNPEGDRRTMLVDKEWDAPGLRTAVRVAGTLGRRDDHDIGWIAELAIPFADLGLSGPPQPHEQWRMNLYRIERGEVEEFSAWSPTMKSPADFHVPARFGTLVFVEE